MKISVFVGVVFAFVLASCATGGPEGLRTPLNPHAPIVTVVNGQITVDQPVISIPAGDTMAITWWLPQARYTFPANGIVMEKAAGGEFDCKLADPHYFTCTNKHTKRGTYKYTINVLDGTTPLTPLDPWVDNG